MQRMNLTNSDDAYYKKKQSSSISLKLIISIPLEILFFSNTAAFIDLA